MLGINLFLIIVFNSSPKPGAWGIRHTFRSEVQITDQKNYQKAKHEFSLIKDKQYIYQYKNNSFDIYYPKKSKGDYQYSYGYMEVDLLQVIKKE